MRIFFFLLLFASAYAAVPTTYYSNLTQYINVNNAVGWELCASYVVTNGVSSLNVDPQRCQSTNLAVGCAIVGSSFLTIGGTAPSSLVLGTSTGNSTGAWYENDYSTNWALRVINSVSDPGAFNCDNITVGDPNYALCWKNLGQTGGYAICGPAGKVTIGYEIRFYNLPCYTKNAGDSCQNSDFPCITGATCNVNGTCDGGTSIPQPALTQCQSLGPCNTTTVQYSVLNSPAGSFCSDNACLLNQVCDGFSNCVNGTFTGCGIANQCQSFYNNTLANCNATTGQCGTYNLPDNTTCITGNMCAAQTICLTGQCTDVGELPYTPSVPCAYKIGCNNATGQFIEGLYTNGENCTSLNLCATAAICPSNGSCTPIAYKPTPSYNYNNCEDTPTCDPFTGNFSTPLRNSGPCSTNPCLFGQSCNLAYTCTGGFTNISCPTLECYYTGAPSNINGTCSCNYQIQPNGTSCGNATVCEKNPQCISGSCVYTPVTCPGDDCNGPTTCHPVDGCYNPINNGLPCDMNPCYYDQFCDDGTCAFGVYDPTLANCTYSPVHPIQWIFGFI